MKHWLLLVCLSSIGVSCAQPPPTVSGASADEVSIRSAWAGLSPDSPLITELMFKRSEAGYTMTGMNSRAGKLSAIAPVQVPVADVEALVTAANASPSAEFATVDLGRPGEDIQARIEEETDSGDDFADAPAIADKLRPYRDSLRRPEVLAATLTDGFRSFHTDDYPRVQIEITLTDGSKLAVSSRSQQYLMLPWSRKGGPSNYSTAISQALWQLLPEGATNRKRLHGPISDFELDELVSAALFDPLNQLKAEATAGEALRVLDANFAVESAKAQKRFSGMDLGPVLFASLRLPDGPENLSMQVRLPLEGDALEEPVADIERLRSALSLAQAAPALAARMRDQPGEDFRMHDRFGYTWLNERTADQFIAQMKQLGKLEELGDGPGLMRGAVMVEEGNAPAHWIVLADGRAVLWKKYTNAPATAGTARCASILTGEDIDELLQSRKDDLCIGEIYPALSK